MRTKTLIIIALAFAAGGTCPSDVNNDGTVGINDFLAVLAAWGPCPNATVVATDFNQQYAAVAWSDGRVSVGITVAGFFVWDDAPPSFYGGMPVDVEMGSGGGAPCTSGLCFDQGFDESGGYQFIYRTYADGYIERIRALFCVSGPLYDELCVTWGVDQPDTWDPVPGPMMELRK